MPITRKPKPQITDNSSVDVEALINRGGSVAAQIEDEAATASNSTQKQNATVNLRIPLDLLGRIDHSLENRPLKTPRHTWILEALLEKLSREQKDEA